MSSIPCHDHTTFYPVTVTVPYDGHFSCLQSFGPKNSASVITSYVSVHIFLYFLLKNIRIGIERSENRVVWIRLVYIGQTHLFWDREKLELGGIDKRIKLI